MELLNFSQINHHSFMRWSDKEATETKKNIRNTTQVFDPMSLDFDSLERDLMVTAFSA